MKTIPFIFFFSLFLANSAFAAGTAEQAIYQRIKPVFSVQLEHSSETANKATKDKKSSASPQELDGKIIYQKHCAMCHASGLAGAPKLDDRTAWQERNKQGIATLVKHAIEGFKAMPAKGGCATCSNTEIENAVKYMIKQANKNETS